MGKLYIEPSDSDGNVFIFHGEDKYIFDAETGESSYEKDAALRAVKTAVLAADGWSTQAPYTQEVTVAGITAKDNPIVSLDLSLDTLTPEQVKALNKNFGKLDRVVTGAGKITAYCYNGKPDSDFTIRIKGR